MAAIDLASHEVALAALERLYAEQPAAFAAFAARKGFVPAFASSEAMHVDAMGSGEPTSSSVVGSKRSRVELMQGIKDDPPAPSLTKSSPAAAGAAGFAGVPQSGKPRLNRHQQREIAMSKTPSERGYDFKKVRFRHVALHFLYLGQNYHGFAAQLVSSKKGREPPADAAAAVAGAKAAAPGAGKGAGRTDRSPEEHLVETVESALFGALSRACLIEDRAGCGYSRCGRTDAGVSAAGQLVALRLRSKARLFPAAASGVAGAVGADAGSAGPSGAVSEGSAAMPPATPAGAGEAPAAGSESAGPAAGDAGDGEGGEYRTPEWHRADGLDNDAGEPFPAPSAEVDYCTMLNHLLPPDIRVIGWADVGSDAELAGAGAVPGATTTVQKVSAGCVAAAAGAPITAPEPAAATTGVAACSTEALLPPAARREHSAERSTARPEKLESPPLQPFSARFSCTGRVYRYFFVNRGYDVAAMRDAAARLQGTHDFRNFAKYLVENTQNFVRRVDSIRIVAVGSPADVAGAYTPAAAYAGGSEGPALSAAAGGPVAVVTPSALASSSAGVGPFGSAVAAGAAATTTAAAGSAGVAASEAAPIPVGAMCFFEVVGQAFLWHQVRCMAAVLFHVGAGLERPTIIDFLLDVGGECPSRPQYELASEKPLCLHHCTFGEETLQPPASENSAASASLAAAAVAGAPAAAEPSRAQTSMSTAMSSPLPTSMAMAVADDGEGCSRPTWAAPSCPQLYARMFTSAGGLEAAAGTLYGRWEALQIEAALLGSMLQRLNAFAVSAGMQPWQPSTREGLTRGRKYQQLQDRPREPTLGEKWAKLTAEERRKVALIHPHNTKRLLTALGASTAAGDVPRGSLDAGAAEGAARRGH